MININQNFGWIGIIMIFNLSSVTFNIFGANVWSIILNVPLFVPLIPPQDPNDSILVLMHMIPLILIY